MGRDVIKRNNKKKKRMIKRKKKKGRKGETGEKERVKVNK